NRTCEFFLLDLNIENPTIDDLTRIAAVPAGAEVTGAVQVDANTILVNSQHPRTDNPEPFNNSLTMALHGLEAGVTTNIVELIDEEGVKINVQVYPNPVSQNLFFQESGANLTLRNIEVFDLQGRKVYEKVEGNSVNFSEWTNATYVLRAEKLNGTPIVTKVVKN
ncbi:MAG: T9SS type A sorting domain-containing protein, partial [Bacteroidota bacterium]